VVAFTCRGRRGSHYSRLRTKGGVGRR
jgi:hypothetical protein